MELEGVIKYRLDYTAKPPLDLDRFKALNAWRTIFFRLGMIGQDPGRYGGLGFGNLSQRCPGGKTNLLRDRFVVSGTRTGSFEVLTGQHYCLVLECRPEENRIAAEGPVKPSSESLTHGFLYAANPEIQCVIHVHCPEIWRRSGALGIASIPEQVAYGTPEMAESVRWLAPANARAPASIVSMRGHRDGVIAFGRSVEAAGEILVKYLALALSCSEV